MLQDELEYHATGVPSVLVSMLDAPAVRLDGTADRYCQLFQGQTYCHEPNPDTVLCQLAHVHSASRRSKGFSVRVGLVVLVGTSGVAVEADLAL